MTTNQSQAPAPEVSSPAGLANIELPTLMPGGLNMPAMFRAMEFSLIKQALFYTSGNKQKASALLNINRTTLIEKMRKYKMPLNPPVPRRKNKA